METNLSYENFPQGDSFLNGESATISETPEIEDYNREFTYENSEGLIGMPYINYLRLNDDMI